MLDHISENDMKPVNHIAAQSSDNAGIDNISFMEEPPPMTLLDLP